MRKTLCIALVLSLFMPLREAYAIFDIMAKVETVLELYQDINNKVEEYQKMALDIQKKARQGFDLLTSCFKNPAKCDVAALGALGLKASSYVIAIKAIRVMPGAAEQLTKGDLQKVSDKNLSDAVRTSYIYKRGETKDLEKSSENRAGIKSIVNDDTAILFAKGVSARQSILKEDGSLYQMEFKQNNIDEILNAQNIVSIATQQRLNRILEMRAYMASAAATAEMTRQSAKQAEEN